MRFLLKEQPYEKPLAAGSLRYEREGVPTGAVEHWRYTLAVDGFRFLRVDLDGRGSSGDTFLYTLLLNEGGVPEDLRWRFFTANNRHRAMGQVLFEGEAISHVRTVDGVRFEEEVRPRPFFLPTSAGLWLLKSAVGAAEVLTLAMHQRAPEDFMALSAICPEMTAVADGLRVAFGGGWRALRWNGAGFVQKMVRDDGLTAVQSRFLTYGGG